MENRAESYVSKDSLYTSVALLILTGACCVLLFMNHKLQIQNTSLIQQYRSLSGTGGPPVGTKIPTLHGVSVAGFNETVDLSQRANGALLLVLSPTCPHCKANFHNWQDLVLQISKQQVFWVDVAPGTDAKYLAELGVPSGPHLIRLDSHERDLYKFGVTPTTIWLNADGVVQHVWVGELSEDDIKEIREILKSQG